MERLQHRFPVLGLGQPDDDQKDGLTLARLIVIDENRWRKPLPHVTHSTNRLEGIIIAHGNNLR